MILQKQILSKLLKNQEIELLIKVDNSSFGGAAKVLFNTIKSYFEQKQKIITIDDLKSLITTKVAKEKQDVYLTFIDSLDKVESSLTTQELLEQVEENKYIDTLDNLTESYLNQLKNRDISNLQKTINQMQLLSVAASKAITKDIRDTEFNLSELAMTDCFITTMRDYNIPLMGLTIIGGLSGGGKSIFALNQLLYEYEINKNKVSLYSLELPTSQIDLRLYANKNNIELNEAIQDPNIKEKVETWKKEFFEPDRVYINYMRYDIEKLKQAILFDIYRGVKIFIIDYLNLVEYSKGNEEWKQLAEFVKELHTLAMTYGVVIITPTQVEITENSNMELKVTTRGSRELEFSSSTFLLLYRNKEEQDKGMLRLFIPKSRNSQRTTIVLEDEFKYMRFKDTGVAL